MTTETIQNPIILPGRNLFAVKMGWWVLFVLYAGFRVFELDGHFKDIWNYFNNVPNYISASRGEETAYAFSSLISILVIMVSWILALVLFLKKSKDYAAIPVSVMFFTWQTNSVSFWEWVLGFFGANGANPEVNYRLATIISEPFLIFSSIVLMGVFLTFPAGRWLSKTARKIFFVFTSIILFISVIQLLLVFATGTSSNFFRAVELFNLSFSILGTTIISAFSLLIRYWRMKNSTQRQQIKWIVVFFIFLTSLYLIVFLIDLISIQFSILLRQIINLGFYIAFSISIFRYRLWDVDIFINRALVYSGLTGLLGLVGILSTETLKFITKQVIGEDQSILAVIISALPIAAAFTPLRGQLQKWVDRFFKPEEVNFENHFPEFRADVRNMLGTARIVEIVSQQVKKQLKVEFARIYLLSTDSSLHSPAFVLDDGSSPFLPGEDAMKKLTDGKLVVEDDGDLYSLLVPLVVTRPRFPDFLGVIVLGRRLNNMGYSTQILDSLKTLGANAGEAIYLSLLNEQSKQKVLV
jgi:hypothetical protein